MLILNMIEILRWAWCGQHRGLWAVVALWAIVTLFPGGVTGLVAVGASMAGVSGSCGGTYAKIIKTGYIIIHSKQLKDKEENRRLYMVLMRTTYSDQFSWRQI